MKSSEALMDTARLLNEKGWCRGVSRNSLGELCVAQALFKTIMATNYTSDPYYTAATYIAEVLGNLPYVRDKAPASEKIVVWNDEHPGLTKMIVLGTLAQAANLAREAGD